MKVARWLVLPGLMWMSGAAWAAEPRAILDGMVKAEAAQEKLRARYFAREHAEHFKLDAQRRRGKRNFTEDYEMVWLEGSPYRKKVMRNGKPLRGAAKEEEERKMRLTKEQRRAEAAAGKIRKVLQFGNVDWKDVAARCEHRLVGEEVVRGRKAWVVESVPGDGVRGQNEAEARALSYRYQFWIDQEEGVLLEQEMEVVREGQDSAPGSRIRALRQKVGPVWVMESWKGDFHTGASVWWRQEHRYTDYREFGAESKIEFEVPEQKPESRVH